MSAGALWTLQQELLAAAVASLETIPDDLGAGFTGAPERYFVSHGTPTFDCCDQLTVHTPQVGENAGTGTRGSAGKAIIGRVNIVTLFTTITRCVPVARTSGGKVIVPEPGEIEAAGQQISADGWALWNGILRQLSTGMLWTTCDQVFWDGMTYLNPSGGCAGWRLALRANLDGYAPAFGS